MASTLTLNQIISPLRAYPELRPFTDVGGATNELTLSIANEVMQKFLSQPMNWKWNRAVVPTFLTVTLQQDYVTNVTDMGWVEQGWRLDINNNATPKPIFPMEAVRDLQQTSYQQYPFNLSWIPNSLAIMGKWQANTSYFCGYGQATTPLSPIQQFIDANGNILFINSNSLGLSINSPGFSGSVITTTPPFGVSGSIQPAAGVNATPGTTVSDGTVVWTVADPNGYAIRLAGLPPFSGVCWLISAVYQKKPPRITSMTQTVSPVPDELEYIFKQGFRAMGYEQSPEPSAMRKAPAALAKFLLDMQTALIGADRETDETQVFPSSSIMGDNPFSFGFPVGPASPYSYFGPY